MKDLIYPFTVLALFVLAIGGWIANIVKIVGSDFSTIDGELIIRLVGVVVAPLGVIMGYV